MMRRFVNGTAAVLQGLDCRMVRLLPDACCGRNSPVQFGWQVDTRIAMGYSAVPVVSQQEGLVQRLGAPEGWSQDCRNKGG